APSCHHERHPLSRTAERLPQFAVRQRMPLSRTAERLPQFAFGSFEHGFPPATQSPSRTVDIKTQHRPGGLIRISFAPPASSRRALERGGDLLRVAAAKDALVKIEGVAARHHVARPAPCRGTATGPTGSRLGLRRPSYRAAP